jgi:MFS family permease
MTTPGVAGSSGMNAAYRLALGRLVSLGGGSASYVALVASLYQRTGSSAWVAAALLASVTCSAAAAPAAGYLGDRFDRRTLMIASDLAAAAVLTALAVLDEPAAMVVLFGLTSIAESPFGPASAAALPNLVEPRSVARANGLVASTSAAGYLVGPLLGGAVLGAGASPAALFLADAATFLLSAALVASIRGSFGGGHGTLSHPGVLAGVAVIRRDHVLLPLVLANIACLAGISIVNVAGYPLSLRLGGGPEGYGALEALLGGGGLAGAALAARLLDRRSLGVVLPAAFVAAAAGLVAGGAAPVLAVALAGFAVAGAGRGLADVAVTTLLQARTADAVRSRVVAAHDAAAHVAYGAAFLVAGALVGLAGPRTSVLGGAALCLIATYGATRLRAPLGEEPANDSGSWGPMER